MKRSLFTAALATLAAGSALAQSNVTIYGRVNESLERIKLDTNSRTYLVDNASRIGFKGEEDLGGGLKAGFVIEHGFNADNGTAASGARFWARETTVRLSHNQMGTLRLGNMPASEGYFATADYVSMHNHDNGTSADAFYGGVAVGTLQNAIAYTSPTFAGARLDVQYALSEGAAGFPNQRSFALNYDLGSLHLGAGYEATSYAKSLALRALYEFGAFTVGGYVERNSGTYIVTGNPYDRRTNIRLAGKYTAGPSEFHLNLGLAGKIDGIDNTDAKQFTVAYNYNMSKRTKAYAFYTKVDNKSAINYGSGIVGTDRDSIALGVRHDF